MSEHDFGLFKLVFDDENGEAFAYVGVEFDHEPDEPDYELVHDFVWEEDEYE